MVQSKRLAEFASCYSAYQRLHLKRLGTELGTIKEDGMGLHALFFFINYAHERQGSNPAYKVFHRAALLKTIKRFASHHPDCCEAFDEAILREGFADTVWNEFKEFAKGKVNERNTTGAVRQVLLELAHKGEPNLVKLLANQHLPEARRWLLGLKGIGPKISSLFLRDCKHLVGLWQEANTANEIALVQPVDTWVNFWFKTIWHIPFPDYQAHHDRCAEIVTRECLKEGTDPVLFNMGAWFCGSQYRVLARFHDLPDDEQVDPPSGVARFSVGKILDGISRFEEALPTGTLPLWS